MRSVNRVTLIGRLVESPICSDSPNSTVCNFLIETEEQWKSRSGQQNSRTIQHRCTAFGPGARAVRNMRVGGFVYLEGALRCSAPPDSGENVSDEIVCFVAQPLAVASPSEV